MGKVTIYIDAETEAKARAAAQAKRISLSKWIAGVIKKEVADEWPESVRNLTGAWAISPTCMKSGRALARMFPGRHSDCSHERQEANSEETAMGVGREHPLVDAIPHSMLL